MLLLKIFNVFKDYDLFLNDVKSGPWTTDLLHYILYKCLVTVPQTPKYDHPRPRDYPIKI